MNYLLYIFSKIFGSKIANWIDNDEEINVTLVLILVVIPVFLIIYFSDLDENQKKGALFASIAVGSCLYVFIKPYFNFIVVLNFIFWFVVFLFNFAV